MDLLTSPFLLSLALSLPPVAPSPSPDWVCDDDDSQRIVSHRRFVVSRALYSPMSDGVAWYALACDGTACDLVGEGLTPEDACEDWWRKAIDSGADLDSAAPAVPGEPSWWQTERPDDHDVAWVSLTFDRGGSPDYLERLCAYTVTP